MSAFQGKTFFKIKSPVTGNDAWLSEDAVDIRVTADGYIRTRTPFGQGMENILPFPQVVTAIEEEKREWWKA